MLLDNLSDIKSLFREGRFNQAIKIITNVEKKFLPNLGKKPDINLPKDQTGTLIEVLLYKARIFQYETDFKAALSIVSFALELSKTLVMKKYMIASLIIKANVLYSVPGISISEVEDMINQINEVRESEKDQIIDVPLEWQTLFLYVKAGVFIHLNQYSNALDTLYGCLELQQRLKLTLDSSNTLEQIGCVLFTLGNIREGKEYFSQALNTVKELHVKRRMAALFSHLAGHQRDSDEKQAIENFSKGITLYRELGDQKELSRHLNNLGAVFRKRGKLDKALELFEESLSLRKKANDLQGVISSYLFISTIHKMKSDYNGVVKYLQEALELSEGLSEATSRNFFIVETSLLFAETYTEMGEFKTSLEYCQKALKWIKNAAYKECRLHWIYQYIGNNYYRLGWLNLALENYFQAHTYFEEAGLKDRVCNILKLIGDVYRRKGDYETALPYFQQSLFFIKALGVPVAHSLLLNSMGMVYKQKGDLEMALEAFNDSLSILEDVEHPLETEIPLFNLVLISADLGNREKSKAYLDKMKTLAEIKHEPILHQRIQLAESLYLKKGKRITEKAKAQDLLYNIVNNEHVFDQEITTLAMLNLCELLIDELKLYGEEEVLEEVQKVLERIITFSNQHDAFLVTIQVLILQSKLNFVIGEIDNADQILIQAQTIASEHGFLELNTRVTSERAILNKEASKMKLMVETGSSVLQRIEESNINSYLASVRQIMEDYQDKPVDIIPEEM